MSIGKQLTDLRNKKGLTRVQLAEELQIPMTTLRNYEQDQREPGHKFLVDAARYFGVTTDYILENEKSPASEGTEDKISVDDMKAMLRGFGFLDANGDLSDDDLKFLSSVFDLLDAWFSR